MLMPQNWTRRGFLSVTGSATLCATTLGVSGWICPAAQPGNRIAGSRLKTSLNAYSFNQALTSSEDSKRLSLFELLEFCARHNFDAIDPTGYYFPNYPNPPTDAYIYEFKSRAFRLGLDISGTGVRNNFASPDKASRAADVELVKKWIEVAAKLGAPVIRVFAGAVPAGYEQKWEEVAAWMVESLGTCADFGRKHGVIVGIQNHGDMLKTAEQALRIVREVDSDWFGVIVDTGCFNHGNPYQEIAAVLPYAVNFQVKESPHGRESTERIDLKRLVSLLRAANYRGYLPIETLPFKGRVYDPHVVVPQFLEELRAAMKASE